MGGQNHQPCNKYLAISIAISRAMTLGRAELEIANVSLEDILLAELDNQTGRIEPMIRHLNQSRDALRTMMNTINDLRQKMDDEGYEDLPTLATTDLNVFGAQCTDAGLHRDSLSWAMVANTMRASGFYAILDLFEDNVRALMQETTDLIGAVTACNRQVKAGELSQTLEYNNAGNFKVEFFKLYSGWEDFYQIFQASSMISTELWYRFNGKGSLLGTGTPTQAVA